MRNTLIIILILAGTAGFAQLKLSGYGEVFYAHEFERYTGNTRDAWFYNHNLHNTIAPNLMLLEARYNHKGVYAQLDLMFGSYAGAIMANEPLWAQPLYQAYVGTSFGAFDVEAGIFESGIGLESAKGMENPTLTRSISAENTPYFLSGARVRWEDNTGILLLEGAVINGWETVVRHSQDSYPGGMFRLKLGSKKVHLHYNILYTEDVGGWGIAQQRLLQGGYFKHALNTWQWFLGYDNVRTGDLQVHMPYIILRKEISERFAVAARGEYARDFTRTQFLRPHDPELPYAQLRERDFEVWSASLNTDYSPKKNLLLRAEIRYMDGQTEQSLPLFRPGGVPPPEHLRSYVPYNSFLFSVSANVKF